MLRALFAGLLLTLPAVAAGADVYPARPVRLIAPFSPGGGVDIVARSLRRNWPRNGDNRSSSTTAPERPASSHRHRSACAARRLYAAARQCRDACGNVSLYQKFPYDAVKGFAPITLIGRYPKCWCPSGSARRHGERADRARRGQTVERSGRPAPAARLISPENIPISPKVKLVHIPYKGSAPALTDLLGGQINMYFGQYPAAAPLAKSGRFARFGVTGQKGLRSHRIQPSRKQA